MKLTINLIAAAAIWVPLFAHAQTDQHVQVCRFYANEARFIVDQRNQGTSMDYMIGIIRKAYADFPPAQSYLSMLAGMIYSRPIPVDAVAIESDVLRGCIEKARQVDNGTYQGNN